MSERGLKKLFASVAKKLLKHSEKNRFCFGSQKVVSNIFGKLLKFFLQVICFTLQDKKV
jgi:hypothetical protein